MAKIESVWVQPESVWMQPDIDPLAELIREINYLEWLSDE